MLTRITGAVLPLALIIAVPLLLREGNIIHDRDADQLVIISPHNEAIRHEFENAFRVYCRERHNRNVDIDWRTPGGTSEIIRHLKSEYTASFRRTWTDRGGRWTQKIRHAFLDRKFSAEDASPEMTQARQMFLDGKDGVGIDLIFGGGQFDYGRMAAEGILVPCGVSTRNPEFVETEPPLVRKSAGGEIWRDPEDRYWGTCLSSFGIAYNHDCIRELSDENRPLISPSQWSDLANPAFFKNIGVADPSKSGSITKCFEMLIQQQMARSVKARQNELGRAPDDTELRRALSYGWEDALLLIRQIGGNAAYFTFSASKVPIDVAQGNVAAGMCIDFYGRSQAEWEERHNGRATMSYVTPRGGSSVACDPIAILRGAPHRKIAEDFVDFVLSKDGQRLWNYRPGTPGGAKTYALRRLPIRRDMYSDDDRNYMSDPGAAPLELAEEFTYHPEWTGRLFGLIRILIRVMIIDSHAELQECWKAIIDAGGPGACPEAMRVLRELPFPYEEAGQAARSVQSPEDRVFVSREWADFFRTKYHTVCDLTAGKGSS